MKAINKTEKEIPEILAPAGDAEILRLAYLYGADAAYIGAGDFSLRQLSGFDLDGIAATKETARSFGKKLYVAVNAFPDNGDMAQLPAFLRAMNEIRPDALIVSDPGVIMLAQQNAPDLELHLSTQVNTTNWLAARFWRQAGCSRIVLARELSLAEATEIAARSGIDIEIFVHGAICISYSGRCLMSSYMTARSANHGHCSQPCRWHYALMEEKRPGQFFPIEEDGKYSYFFNSKDLCLIEHIPELLAVGARAWKIEGRNKSAYYVANTVRVYKAARDACLHEGESYRLRPAWLEELARVSHRGYTENFAFGQPGAESFRYDRDEYIRDYDFAAVARQTCDGWLELEERNHFDVGDELEILLPDGRNLTLPVTQIIDANGESVPAARHACELVRVPYHGQPLTTPLICRRQVKQKSSLK